MTRPILRDMPLGRGLLLVLAMCAAGVAVDRAARSDALRAYVLAFWRGTLTGPAEWLGWAGVVLLGVALAGLIALGLCALVAYLERHETPLGDYTGDELEPETLTERRRRARFTSLIVALGLLAVPVIAFTR